MKGKVEQVILIIDGKEITFEPLALSYNSRKEVFETMGGPMFTGVTHHKIEFSTTDKEAKNDNNSWYWW